MSRLPNAPPVGEPSAGADTQRPGRLPDPPQGWGSLLLLLVMLAAAGMAIDAITPAGTNEAGVSLTAALPLLMVVAGLVGSLLAMTRLGILLAHLMGALAGTGVVLVMVSGSLFDDPDAVVRVSALREAMYAYLVDVVSGTPTRGVPLLLLVLGALFWTTGQYSAFTLFRRSQVLHATVAPGAMLLAAIMAGDGLSLAYLVAFCAAALLLQIRLNLTRQRLAWARRHVVDGGEVSRLFLRAGAAFSAVVLVGASVLATVGTSAPLSERWRELDDRLLEWRLEWEQMVGQWGIQAPPSANLFGPRQPVGATWDESTALDFIVAASDKRPHYWRAATYNEFRGGSWLQSRPRSYEVRPGEGVLSGSTDALDLDGTARREVIANFSLINLPGNVLLAPAVPDVTDRDVVVYTSGEAGPLLSIQHQKSPGAGKSYSVSARVPLLGAASGGLTGNQLAAASVDYPPFILEAGYLSVAEGSVGEQTRRAVADLVADMPARDRDNPYRVALAVEGFLRQDGGFRYDTDLRGDCRPGEAVSDCLLRSRRGFCVQYATTMVMMLRLRDVPARYVLGYLPGRRVAGGSYEVERAALHAWVEVYFPEHGWVRFDPTPGQTERGSEPSGLPEGPRVAEPTLIPERTFEPEDPRATEPLPEPSESPLVVPPEVPDEPSGRGDGVELGLGLGVGALLAGLVLMVALAVRRLRRLPSPESELAYRGVVSMASRTGRAPAASQTVFEYVAALAEEMPDSGADLELVAQARVEAVYGRRPVADVRLVALRSAYARIRVALLRMLLRRRGGGSGP